MALTVDELNIQIAADSKNATRALTSLIKKLEKLQGTLSNTGGSNITITNSFNKTTNSINKAATATDKYDETAKKTTKTSKTFTDQLAQQISKWRTLFGAFKSVANTMAEWFNESTDYIETLNLFNVTMGAGAEEAQRYAEKVSDLMGIDIAEWMQYQGTFKQLTSGFGVASEQANVMSQNLTQLSYDLASFFNTDVETAFDKLSSAMSGQVKGLREFGIDTTVASLQEYALSRGIETKVRAMTQAEKSLLRYNYIMEKSIIIQGDMARTIITPANALRILGAQLTQMKRALGNIVSVIVVKFIPYVQAMVEIIKEAAIELANFFGFEIPKIDYSSLDTGGFADDLESGEESLEGASDTLKKIKKQLMGFDELNIINNPDADAAGGAGGEGVGGGLNGMKPLEYNFLSGLDINTEKIKEQIRTTLSQIATIASGFMLAIGTILTVTGANIPLGVSLMAVGALGIASEVATNWSAMNAQIAETLSAVTSMVGGFLLAVGAIMAFSGANIPLGIALMVGGAIGLATSLAIDWTKTEEPIKNTLVTLEGLVGGAFLGLGAMLAFSGASIPLGIAFLAAGAAAVMSAATLNWDSASNEVKGVVGSITTTVGAASLVLGALLAFTGVSLPMGIAFIAAGAISIITGAYLNWNATTDKVRAVVTTLTAVVGGAALAIGAILAFSGINIPLGVGLIAAGAVSIATSVGLNWDAVKQKINTVLASLLAIISGFGLVLGVLLCLTGAGIPLGLGLIFASIKGTQKAASMDDNPITRFVKNMANGIIKIFNWVIDAINDMFHITFDGLTIAGVQIIPKIDARLVNLPRIPLLAEGGLVDAGQMFIAREAGPELVGSIGRKTAVANNEQIISGIENGVYRAMVAANSNNKGGTQTIRIINEIDGDVVGEKVIQYHNGKVIQTGVSPLLV